MGNPFDSFGSSLNLPTIDTSSITGAVSNGVGTAQQLANYATADFSLPSVTQKVAELGSKMSISGVTSLFGQATVSSTGIAAPTQDSINMMLAQSNFRQQELKGIPASLLSGGGGADTTELKVIISQEPEVGDLNELVFTVMPKIDESGAVEYDMVTPVHHPGAIMKYRTTGARKWSVSGRLVSRTVQEASDNLEILNMVRSWRMPFYGEGTANDFLDKLGAPPPILTLKAYGPNMIGPVKCVLTNYSWSFDNTIDYITTADGNPFPVIMDVSLTLEESWSPAEFSGFSLTKFKEGDLSATGAFQRVTASASNQPPQQNVAAASIPNTTAPSAEAIQTNQNNKQEPVTSVAPGTTIVNGQQFDFNF